MERIRIDAVEQELDSATIKRPLTDVLGATDVAINYYELAPGDSFAFGYHMHENQEEIFVLQQGEAVFETETGEITVGAGEAIRFGPGEYQQGVNRGDERVIALAIGAPQETGSSEVLRDCETCGERTPNAIELTDDGTAKVTRCLQCDTITARFT